MSITVNQTANTNNWQVLFNTVNQLAGLLTANVITADATSNGSVTIGNTYFLGIFATSNLVANTVRGGNNSVTGTLNVSSNVAVNSSSQINLGNFSVNSTVLAVGTSTINTTSFSAQNFIVTNTFTTAAVSLNGITAASPINVAITNTSLQTIDSWLFTSNTRSAEYTLSISDSSTNSYQISKLWLITDGASSYMTEVVDLQTNAAILTLSASSNSTAVLLQAQTISSTSTTVKGHRLAIGN